MPGTQGQGWPGIQHTFDRYFIFAENVQVQMAWRNGNAFPADGQGGATWM
jgi:hypothetical protein